MGFLDKNHNEEGQKNIQRIFVIGCMVYVSLGFAFQLSETEMYDPFWLRFLVGSLGLSAIILSEISDFFKKHFSATLLFTMLVYNAHVYFLLYMNDFDAGYRTSILAVVITTILFIPNKRLHIIYNIMNIATYTGLMFLTDHFDHGSINLGMLMTIVLVFGYLKNSDSIDAYRIMQTNQNLLKTVNNNIYNGIFRINTDFDLLYANDYLMQMLGFENSDSEEIADKMRNLLDRNLYISSQMDMNGTIKDIELKLYKKDGSEIWGLLNMSPVLNTEGELQFYDGTLVDISDKKIADRELKIFSAAIDHTPTGVVITNRFGRITYANQYFAKLIGYSIDEVLGTKVESYGLLDDAVQAHAWQELISGRVWKGELNFKSKTKQVMTELLSVAPIRNDKGEISNFVMVTEDITDRKRSEMELLHAKEQAEEATQAKEQFLSTMSHELRTPMNSVIGITNLLLEESPRPDQAENLNILKFSAGNLLAIINDILDLSKIEAGRIEFIEEDFDLHYTLINIKRTHAVRAQEKSVDIKLTVDNALPSILKGDPQRLNQILNNLVSNAIKFTEEGFVHIHVDTVKDHRNEVELSIRVQDSGIGIPCNKLDTIFESFRQASAETSNKYGGTGLGLAITRKLVELQGGSIHVESEVGTGSSFIINMSFMKGDVMYRAKKETPIINNGEQSKLNGVRILLVDDNKINQKVAQKFLAKWDTEVIVANNGKEAIDMLQTNELDVILMDLQMPEMGGMEATQHIRKLDDPFKKQIPVIALTAAAMNHEREQAMDAGMNDYICKPFQPQELFTKLVLFSLKSKETRLSLANGTQCSETPARTTRLTDLDPS